MDFVRDYWIWIILSKSVLQNRICQDSVWKNIILHDSEISNILLFD